MVSICIALPTTRCPTPNQTFVSVAADSQISPRWQTTVRFGTTNQESLYTNPTPTGTPFDPFGFGANYLGETVTLTDAEGRTVTGQGILDYGGVYPQFVPVAHSAAIAVRPGDVPVRRATWRFRAAAASSTRLATAIPTTTRRTRATTAVGSSRDARRW